MNTAEIIEKIWRHTEPTVYLSRKEFIEGLEGWSVRGIAIDGELVGATLIKGPEFHFVSFGVCKIFPPAIIRDCLQPIIDEHGFARTRTPSDDMRQQRFNVKIGFRKESEDEHFVWFRMEILNLHGARACLS